MNYKNDTVKILRYKRGHLPTYQMITSKLFIWLGELLDKLESRHRIYGQQNVRDV